MRPTTKRSTFPAIALLVAGSAGYVGAGTASGAHTRSRAASRERPVAVGPTLRAARAGAKWETLVGEYSSRTAAVGRLDALHRLSFARFTFQTTKNGAAMPGTSGTPPAITTLGGASGACHGPAHTAKTLYVVTKSFASEAGAKRQVRVLRSMGFVAYAVPKAALF